MYEQTVGSFNRVFNLDEVHKLGFSLGTKLRLPPNEIIALALCQTVESTFVQIKRLLNHSLRAVDMQLPALRGQKMKSVSTHHGRCRLVIFWVVK